MESFFNSHLFFGEDILNSLHLFLGTWFDYVMIGITTSGNQIFYIVIPPIVYWCIDKKNSLKVLAVFLFSVTVNDMAKEISQMPRPDPEKLISGIRELNLLYRPKSPGFPSGHTQEAVAFWGAVLWYFKKPAIRITSLLFILLVPYSRIYLGVHFLGDIAGGFILGTSVLILLIPLIEIMQKHFEKINMLFLYTALFILPIAVYMILPGKFIYNYMGVFSGLFIGALLENDTVKFQTNSNIPGTLLKICIGLAGIMLIKISLKAVFPSHPVFGFLRYWAMGFWCTFGAPFVFSKISLIRDQWENR